jgi:hypothetical protein
LWHARRMRMTGADAGDEGSYLPLII